jgi:hypothetical protein
VPSASSSPVVGDSLQLTCCRWLKVAGRGRAISLQLTCCRWLKVAGRGRAISLQLTCCRWLKVAGRGRAISLQLNRVSEAIPTLKISRTGFINILYTKDGNFAPYNFFHNDCHFLFIVFAHLNGICDNRLKYTWSHICKWKMKIRLKIVQFFLSF